MSLTRLFLYDVTQAACCDHKEGCNKTFSQKEIVSHTVCKHCLVIISCQLLDILDDM